MTKIVLDRIVQEIIGRILSVVKPTRVFLFGSAARNEMRENSDIDLLVVVPNGLHRRRTAQNIYRNMLGVGFAADIVAVGVFPAPWIAVGGAEEHQHLLALADAMS